MDQKLCNERFHEALSKAFSARADGVRMAYFDLASFYQRQLVDEAHLVASNDDLRRCLVLSQSSN